MAFSKQEIEDIAVLARLALAEEEKESLTQQLNSMLAYVDKLQELDTSEVEPLVHILNLTNVLRADEVMPSPKREEMLQNSTEAEAGYYKVPKIM